MLENIVWVYFAQGVAKSTKTTYSSAQCRYLTFCELYQIPPLPLSEMSVCLFAAFLVHQGLRAQPICLLFITSRSQLASNSRSGSSDRESSTC